ncbi:hypothetical protein HDU76_009340, partial [Blyttiomyces sp. JEL0837]
TTTVIMAGKKKNNGNPTSSNWGGSRAGAGKPKKNDVKTTNQHPDKQQPSLARFGFQKGDSALLSEHQQQNDKNSLPLSSTINIDTSHGADPEQTFSNLIEYSASQTNFSILDTQSETPRTTTQHEIQEKIDHQLSLVIQIEENESSAPSISKTDTETPATTTRTQIQVELDHQLALVIQNEENQSAPQDPPFDANDFVAKIVEGKLYSVNNLPTNFTVSTIIAKDGNCLFRCFSWWSHGHQEQHQYWRKKITNFIKNNPKPEDNKDDDDNDEVPASTKPQQKSTSKTNQKSAAKSQQKSKTPQQKSDTHREERTDPRSMYLLDLLDNLKGGKYDTQLKEGKLWIVPPNPSVTIREAFLKGNKPNPHPYYYPRAFFFVPHLTWSEA